MINQPIIHDRHIVKEVFGQIMEHGGFKNVFSKPDNLTILTVRNEGSMEDRLIPKMLDYKYKSILEANLEYLGIQPLVVLTDPRLPWRNTFKIEMLHNYLNSGKCTTEYFMFCDAVDVIFKDDPQMVIDIFETFDCDALFMSTTSTLGYNCMPDVKRFVDELNNGTGRYMNTGVYIGRTEFIKEVIEDALQYAFPHGTIMDEHPEWLSKNPPGFPIGSDDQCILRYIEPKFYPRMKVDYQNLMAYRS